MQAGRKDSVFAQIHDDAEVVVFKSVPEIRGLTREQLQPGPGIRGNVVACLSRPIPRNLRAFERSASGSFRLVDRVTQHLALTGVKSGKARVTGRFWIVPEPQVDSAMRGEKDWVAGDEAVVDPAGRRANDDADEQ